MPRPAAVATVKRIVTDGKEGARRVAIYYAGGAKVQEIGTSEREIKGAAHYYAVAGARWFGGSCAALGVVEGSVVHERDLERLLRQQDPRTGELLPNNGTKRAKVAAFDLTISVPKELSICYLMADAKTQKVIYEIIEEANRSALEYAQTYGSKVRRGKDGIVPLSSDGFIVSQTFHPTARPVDGKTAPSLHFHNPILNMAVRNGVVTALNAKEIFGLQKTFGALAGQIIREQTEELLGFHWIYDDKGIPRVEGFDEEIRQRLSLRQHQILEHALAAGADITRRKDMVYHQSATKEGKSACGNDQQALVWAKEMLEERGYTIDVIDEKLREVNRAYADREQQVLADRAVLAENFEPQPTDGSKIGAWRFRAALALSGAITDDAPRQLTGEDWRRLDAALEMDERTPEQKRDDMAHEAMMSVGRLQATWHEHDLHTALLVAGIPRDEAIDRAKSFIASNDAVRLFGLDDDPRRQLRVAYEHQGVFATRELKEKEDYVFDFVKSGIGQAPRTLSEGQLADIVAQMKQRGHVIEPDSEQYQMVYALLCGTNRATAVVGLAGSGKSTGAEMYSLALEAGFLAERAGYLGPTIPSDNDNAVRHHVVGMALAAAAAENLERSAGISSYSLAMGLSRLEAGTLVIEPGGTVLIDESSQASTDQLFRLIPHLERANARLVMLGDPRQKQSIEAGGMYATIAATLPETVVRLYETRRQENLEERAVLAYLHDSRASISDNYLPLSQGSREALLRQRVSAEFLDTLKSPKDAVDWYYRNNRVKSFEAAEEQNRAAASRYWDEVERALRTGTDPTKATLIMAISNEKIRELDTASIDEAVKRGHLDPSQTVEFGKRTLLVGQRILSRKVDRRLDVLNGYGATVVGVEEVISSFEVALKGGSPYSTTRVMSSSPALGDLVYEKFSEERVRREQTNSEIDLNRRVEHLDSATARLASAHERAARARARAAKLEAQLSSARTESSRSKHGASFAAAQKSLDNAEAKCSTARGLVALREEKLAHARDWARWAQALPHGGGMVGLAVAQVTAKKTEKRLKVRLDDGGVRHLTEAFVNAHADSGYAVTDQRSQGQSVGVGIVADAPNYTMLSRDRETTEIYQTVPRDRDEEAARKTERTKSLQTVNDWLAGHLPEGRDNEFFVLEADRLRASSESRSVPVTDQLSVRMERDDDSITESVANEVAQANWLGERKVAVARTSSRAHELSDAIVLNTVAMAAGTLRYHKIDDRLWVKNMPVIVGRGDIEGLEHGHTYFVAGAASRGIILDIGGGKTHRLSAEEVAKHVDSGYAITSARMRIGTDAESYVVEGHDLSESDLSHLEEKSVPSEIVVVDPQLEVDHEYDNACRANVLEAFETDLKVEPRSHSAMYFREYMERRYGADAGLDSLQAAMKNISGEVNEIESLPKRDLARRDLDRAIFKVEAHRAKEKERLSELWGERVEDLSVVESVINPAFGRFGTEEDNANEVESPASPKEIDRETRIEIRDALRGLHQLESDRRALDRRYEVVTSNVPDWDPAVEAEIKKSELSHADAMNRKVEIEEMLTHYVDMHVLDAMKAPKPYHQAAGLIFDVKDPDYERSRGLLVQLEEFRLRWAVTDRNLPLGEAPEIDDENPGKNALQLTEYQNLSAMVKGHEAEPSLAHVR
jgi:conjugative relaxase-like TrwC/TraI family protein